MAEEPKEKPSQPEAKPKPPSTPLVFISHDARDSELAEAFSKLLRSVSAGMLKSFYSSDRKGKQGIEFGSEWYPSLMKKLCSASDVVCLLTERSVGRPWILYEAGVAKGKLDVPIIGIALGISVEEASIGPFSQFQNCGDDVDSLTKLVTQLLSRIRDLEPDPDIVSREVKAFKKKVDVVLDKLAPVGEPEKEDKPSDQKAFLTNADQIFSGLSEAALAILQLYYEQDETMLHEDMINRSGLPRRFRRIQIEFALDELKDAGIVNQAPADLLAIDPDSSAYSLTARGKKYLAKRNKG